MYFAPQSSGSVTSDEVRWEFAMMTFLRSLRGAIGMGVTWALAWFAAGFALGPVIGPIGDDVPLPIVCGMFGFMSGVTFSGVLKLVAGRRRFDELSLGRFAWRRSGWSRRGGAGRRAGRRGASRPALALSSE
jgi:hypothetical protein